MKRTNIYADEQDLADLKEAADQRGISHAEILREAIHLAALKNRTARRRDLSGWPVFDGTGENISKDEARQLIADRIERA